MMLSPLPEESSVSNDMTRRVLDATPEGKGSRARTPGIAHAAGVPVNVAAGILLDAVAAGTVGRMERAGVESWWRWPVSSAVACEDEWPGQGSLL